MAPPLKKCKIPNKKDSEKVYFKGPIIKIGAWLFGG
jgi:hypothetical protein